MISLKTDPQASALRNWKTVGGMTFLSRLAGYARDLAVAYFLGAGYQSDAFYVAFRIPNLLRRLFAEGMLSASFIPVFTERLTNKGSRGAREELSAVFTCLVLVTGLVATIGIVFAPHIVRLFASGFGGETFSLATGLLQMMFPYIVLISVAAVSMGALNSAGHFFAPAIAPVLFNLTFIAALVFFQDRWTDPAVVAALGVLAGGALQTLINLPFLRSRGLFPVFVNFSRHSALLKRIGTLMLPQLFGVAVYNLNIIINTQYASHMDSGTVSYLYFAERLTEFPLGVGAVAIATALLPQLSAQAARGDMEGFRENFGGLLRMTMFITLPALAGLIALGQPICSVLFERGEFTASDAIFSSEALAGYAAGLWAVAGIRVTAPAFFALGDTKTPVRAATVALAVNIVLGYVLGFSLGMKHTGLALASSMSAAVNFVVLLRLLGNRAGGVTGSGFGVWCFKATAAAALAGIVAKASYDPLTGVAPQTAALLVAIAVGALVFAIASKALGIREIEKLTG